MQDRYVRNRCRIGIGLLGFLFALGIAVVAGAAEAPAAHSPLTGVVNVNRASAVELQLLPGVGPARAQAIIEARAQGLQPFCVTIDARGNDYLPYLFGRRGYAVIHRPSQLPRTLPVLYSRLTAA